MNLEKFTDRARRFVQAAQTIAMRESHQRLTPDHLLKALLDDDQGFATSLIARAGGDAQKVRAANDLSVAKLPKVQGGQVYLDQSFAQVVDQAEQLAKKASDSFVTVERLLTALAIQKSDAAKALADGGADPTILSVLGLKASQSHGITDPLRKPDEQVSDRDRIKALARRWLEERGAAEALAA